MNIWQWWCAWLRRGRKNKWQHAAAGLHRTVLPSSQMVSHTRSVLSSGRESMNMLMNLEPAEEDNAGKRARQDETRGAGHTVTNS